MFCWDTDGNYCELALDFSLSCKVPWLLDLKQVHRMPPLAKARADPNEATDHGVTAIFRASQGGHHLLLGLLLEAGGPTREQGRFSEICRY